MKTNSLSTEILIIGTFVIPFIYLGIIWSQLPTQIVTHYDLSGHANDTMPKETAALLMGGLSVLMYFVLRYLPNIDPNGRLQSSNYDRLRFVITLTLAAITGWLWYMAGHQASASNSTGILFAIIGVMMAGIGNYLTTVRPNWVVGIRTPWTLSNEVVWRKTHRMGGRLMVAGGLLSAVLALVIPMPYTIAVVAGIILLVSFIPVAYSYIYFRQEKTH